MDIRGIIPNKDKNWEIRNNILYYRKYGMIPLANIIDDELDFQNIFMMRFMTIFI
jgi:hypothetical protein